MSNRSTHLAHPPHTSESAPAPEHSGEAITIGKVTPFGFVQGVVLTSLDVDIEGRLNPECAQDGAHPDARNRSPALEWEPVPGVAAWCLVVEDPDAPREKPVLHWAIWNLPGALTALPAGVSRGARLVTPQDAVQGLNGREQPGYMGPKPPPGHGPHRYHFQMFALAEPLHLKPDADLNALTNALKADSLAIGELIATFEVPAV